MGPDNQQSVESRYVQPSVEGVPVYDFLAGRDDDLDALLQCCEAEIAAHNETLQPPDSYFFGKAINLAHNNEDEDLERALCASFVELSQESEEFRKTLPMGVSSFSSPSTSKEYKQIAKRLAKLSTPQPKKKTVKNMRDCPDCGKSVSKKAESCPHCGHPFRKKQEFKMPGCLTLLIILFCLPLVTSLCSPKSKTKSVPPPPKKHLSPAELRKQKIERQFSAWDGSHRKLEIFIKNIMNDPDSYDHVKTVYWDKGNYLIVKTTFRGNNAFGGKVINWVRAKVDMDGNIVNIIEQGP